MSNRKSRPKSGTKTLSRQTSGRKGGFGVLTPETVGAMAGAAIGGIAGMMIGNRHHKSKMAMAKEGAVRAVKGAASVLDTQDSKLHMEPGHSSTKNHSKRK